LVWGNVERLTTLKDGLDDGGGEKCQGQDATDLAWIAISLSRKVANGCGPPLRQFVNPAMGIGE
jgi:hypothetical protein